MPQSEQLEQLLCVVAGMSRQTLIEHFRDYPGRFPLDFTPEFLARTPLDRLRHIFVALCLQNQRLPDNTAMAMAA